MGTPKQLAFLGVSLSVTQWLYIAGAILLAALAIFGTGAGIGYGYGAAGATEKAAKTATKLADKVAKEKQAQLTALNAANARNRGWERNFDTKVAEIRAEFNLKEGHEQAVDARTVGDYRAGTDVMRLPVRTCGTAVAAAAEAAADRADGQAGAELTPETAAALYSIAAEGDASIREHNGLIAWAEEAVKLCNASGPPPLPEKTP